MLSSSLKVHYLDKTLIITPKELEPIYSDRLLDTFLKEQKLLEDVPFEFYFDGIRIEFKNFRMLKDGGEVICIPSQILNPNFDRLLFFKASGIDFGEILEKCGFESVLEELLENMLQEKLISIQQQDVDFFDKHVKKYINQSWWFVARTILLLAREEDWYLEDEEKGDRYCEFYLNDGGSRYVFVTVKDTDDLEELVLLSFDKLKKTRKKDINQMRYGITTNLKTWIVTFYQPSEEPYNINQFLISKPRNFSLNFDLISLKSLAFLIKSLFMDNTGKIIKSHVFKKGLKKSKFFNFII